MFYAVICCVLCVIIFRFFYYPVCYWTKCFMLIFDKLLTHSNARMCFTQESTKYFDMQYNSQQIYYL